MLASVFMVVVAVAMVLQEIKAMVDMAEAVVRLATMVQMEVVEELLVILAMMRRSVVMVRI